MNRKYLSIVLKWALFLFIGLTSLSFITEILFSEKQSFIWRAIFYILWLAVVVLCFAGAAKEYRTKLLDGHLKYGQALLYSIIVSLFASILISTFNFTYYEFINKEGFENNIMQGVEAIESNSFFPEEAKEIGIAKMMEITPFSSSVTLFWSNVIFLIFLALIISIFTKKKDESFESQFKDVE